MSEDMSISGSTPTLSQQVNTTAYVYALVDESGYARYIGESLDPAKRIMWHWYNRQYDSGNMPLKEWLRSLGGPPEYVVLDEVSFGDRYAVEGFYTVCFRWAKVPLLNMNDGIKPGDVTRERMRSAKTPEARARISAALTGRVITAETRRRISDGVNAHYAARRAALTAA
jgi:hypothetical protein